MAELSKGGSEMGDRMSSDKTRPAAARSGTCSDGAGPVAAAMRAWASSNVSMDEVFVANSALSAANRRQRDLARWSSDAHGLRRRHESLKKNGEQKQRDENCAHAARLVGRCEQVHPDNAGEQTRNCPRDVAGREP